MKPITRRNSVLLVLVLLFCGTIVSAQDDPGRLLHRQRLEGIDLSPDWRGVVVDWTAMDEEGRSTIYVPRDKPFHVVKLSDFEKTRGTVADLAGEYGRLELLHGTPCFIPSNVTDSNLSVPVTLDLENVSTWEALKTVIRQINCHRRFGDDTVVQVRTLGPPNVPEEFDQVNCITIRVNNVPARDAICMILAQAPLSVGFESRNVYRPDFGEKARKHWKIDIQFYKGNQPIVSTESFSTERARIWSPEVEEAEKPAENCVGDGPSQGLLRVEDLEYDVSSKVQALSLEPGRLDNVERKIDPSFGLLVDEAVFAEEGATVKLLANFGIPFSFRREVDKLSPDDRASQPLEKKEIHMKALTMLKDLGIEALTAGENMISEEDWELCECEYDPSGQKKDVQNCWCLTKKLTYRGIPYVCSFVSIKLDAQSAKPIDFLYFPTFEIDDLDPKISSDMAKETADEVITEHSKTELRYDASRLVIAAPNNRFTRKQGELSSMEILDQRLAWEVSYSYESFDHEHSVTIYVDAKTGEVIGG